MSELAQFRDPVVTVKATDPDQGRNAELIYTIRSTQLYKPGMYVRSLHSSKLGVVDGGGGDRGAARGAEQERSTLRFLCQLP